jgi:hypothetical protein
LDRGIAGADHVFERLTLMGGITLYSFNQIGDEVKASLELYVDLGPSVLDLVSATNQTVIGTDEGCPNDNHNADDE